MKEKKELGDRILSEQKAAKRITNDDLKCKDCIFKLDDSKILGNTSRCEIYPNGKPNKVLLGGDCHKYFRQV